MHGVETLLLVDRHLARLEKANPELAPMARLQAGLTREALTARRPPVVGAFVLSRERAAAKVREGVPLLHDEQATVDIHYAADLFSRLIDVVRAAEHLENSQSLVELVDAATDGRLHAERLFTEAFVQHADHLYQIAVAAEVDADLLATLARLAVGPLLRAYADRLAPVLDGLDDGRPDGAQWTRGYCFVCGGWPILAELRGVELKRHLRCSGCGGGWAAPRLFCPFCGENEHRHLSTLRPDGQRRCWVEVCNTCGGYLKAANSLEPVASDLLALEDLATLHLDVVAIERGYQRPQDSAFHLDIGQPELTTSDELHRQ